MTHVREVMSPLPVFETKSIHILMSDLKNDMLRAM